ncbi:MAG: CHAT domain-containing protein, partial [Bacteroidota bacterium]
KLNSGSPTANLYGNPDFGSDEGIRLKLVDLPGAEKEVKDLSAMMKREGWDVNAYTRTDATELELKGTDVQPTVLHLATHGFFSDNDPILKKITPGHNPMFKSGLYLKGAINAYANYQRGSIQESDNDGILSSYEAMNLNLTETELVVLSACETSLGDIEAGEGVYGLQRAFMVAGAQNIITSLIKVEDRATQLMMSYFYQNYLADGDAASALYKAQINLRQEFPDPRIWGAFVLTGKG